MGTRLGAGEILLRTLPPRCMSTLAPVSSGTPGVIFWFRNDFCGYTTNPLYRQRSSKPSSAKAGYCRCLCMTRRKTRTPLGAFSAWLHSALCDLSEQLRALGSGLGLCQGDPTTVLAELCRTLGQLLLVCEEIAAPEEQAVVQSLRQTVPIHTVWQSTLLEPSSLPFAAQTISRRFAKRLSAHRCQRQPRWHHPPGYLLGLRISFSPQH